ncbi:MAG: hypothetical protein HKM24_02310 [Gammaproteobacteria bacterium]|nr:hypothetical protein [Gammaproteobacteria bacterium]
MPPPRRLIDNKQWQQVWELIAGYEFSFYLAYLDQPDWNRQYAAQTWGPITEDMVFGYGVSDPGVDGPFFFRQVLSVKVLIPPYPAIQKFIRKLKLLTVPSVTVTNAFVGIFGLRTQFTLDNDYVKQT